MSGSGLELLTSFLPWAKRRPRIFLSYRRRGDSAGFAARLADRLVAHFGDEQCFRDIEDIESGMDFVEAIEEAVASSRVMVVVIGTDWVTVTGADGRRRLDNPEDFVRLEVATALRRGIRVIPALVAGATMPSADGLPADLHGLWRRQALELSDTRWDYDVGQLVGAIEGMGIRSKKKRAATVLARRLQWSGVAAAAMVLGGIGWVVADAYSEASDARSAVEAPAQPDEGGGAPDVGTEVGTAAGIDSGTDDAADDAQEVVTKSPPGPSGSSSTSAAAERRPAVRQPVADPPPSAVSRYRDALIEAIDAANEEQNYAQETLDVSGLADIFTGAALQLHVATVGQLFQSGEVSFNTLLSQRYGEFRVDPTETVAEVDVVERWTAEHRNALTGMCMHRIPPWDVPQTVHFRRVGSGWIIENVTGDPVTVPDAVGC